MNSAVGTASFAVILCPRALAAGSDNRPGLGNGIAPRLFGRYFRLKSGEDRRIDCIFDHERGHRRTGGFEPFQHAAVVGYGRRMKHAGNIATPDRRASGFLFQIKALAKHFDR